MTTNKRTVSTVTKAAILPGILLVGACAGAPDLEDTGARQEAHRAAYTPDFQYPETPVLQCIAKEIRGNPIYSSRTIGYTEIPDLTGKASAQGRHGPTSVHSGVAEALAYVGAINFTQVGIQRMQLRAQADQHFVQTLAERIDLGKARAVEEVSKFTARTINGEQFTDEIGRAQQNLGLDLRGANGSVMTTQNQFAAERFPNLPKPPDVLIVGELDVFNVDRSAAVQAGAFGFSLSGDFAVVNVGISTRVEIDGRERNPLSKIVALPAREVQANVFAFFPDVVNSGAGSETNPEAHPAFKAMGYNMATRHLIFAFPGTEYCWERRAEPDEWYRTYVEPESDQPEGHDGEGKSLSTSFDIESLSGKESAVFARILIPIDVTTAAEQDVNPVPLRTAAPRATV